MACGQRPGASPLDATPHGLSAQSRRCIGLNGLLCVWPRRPHVVRGCAHRAQIVCIVLNWLLLCGLATAVSRPEPDCFLLKLFCQRPQYLASTQAEICPRSRRNLYVAEGTFGSVAAGRNVDRVSSIGHRNGFSVRLRWGLPSQGLAGAGVEAVGNLFELGLVMKR